VKRTRSYPATRSWDSPPASSSPQDGSGTCGRFLGILSIPLSRPPRPLVNGIALANRDKTVFCLGSDGSQQEGNDAEAARLAVAQNLNVKVFIDDNDVTIAGHPSEYLKGYDVAKTLQGHGLKVFTVQGEDIDALWGAISSAIVHQGPAAGPYFLPGLALANIHLQ
jgi:hypothetical protein